MSRPVNDDLENKPDRRRFLKISMTAVAATAASAYHRPVIASVKTIGKLSPGFIPWDGAASPDVTMETACGLCVYDNGTASLSYRIEGTVITIADLATTLTDQLSGPSMPSPQIDAAGPMTGAIVGTTFSMSGPGTYTDAGLNVVSQPANLVINGLLSGGLLSAITVEMTSSIFCPGVPGLIAAHCDAAACW